MAFIRKGSVYLITCKHNGKQYISTSNKNARGQLTNMLGSRGGAMSRDVAEYGREVFEIEELFQYQECSKQELLNLKKEFVKAFRTSLPAGYNKQGEDCSLKQCKVCNRTETTKWFTGPICSACQRKEFTFRNDKNYAKNLANRKRYRLRHPEKVAEQKRRSRLKKLDKYLERARVNSKRHHQEKKAYYNAKSLAYQNKKRTVTPSWLSDSQMDAMELFYQQRSKFCHVDHIIPIHHDLISGLNVPWNLQILTAKENLSKGNSFDGTYDNTSWKDGKFYRATMRQKTKIEESNV